MEEQQVNENPDNNYNYLTPSQISGTLDSMNSLVKLLTDMGDILNVLRREFRGENSYIDDEGDTHWVQVSKPIFIRIDFETNAPLTQQEKQPDGTTKDVYVPNDEAIEEILSMLKFAGINKVTAVSGIETDNYLDDLKEFECKLAAVLCLKQKQWGLDKELLPMTQYKIKTIVQDARSLGRDGRILKALQTTVQRVEQSIEGERAKTKTNFNPYA